MACGSGQQAYQIGASTCSFCLSSCSPFPASLDATTLSCHLATLFSGASSTYSPTLYSSLPAATWGSNFTAQVGGAFVLPFSVPPDCLGANLPVYMSPNIADPSGASSFYFSMSTTSSSAPTCTILRFLSYNGVSPPAGILTTLAVAAVSAAFDGGVAQSWQLFSSMPPSRVSMTMWAFDYVYPVALKDAIPYVNVASGVASMAYTGTTTAFQMPATTAATISLGMWRPNLGSVSAVSTPYALFQIPMQPVATDSYSVVTQVLSAGGIGALPITTLVDLIEPPVKKMFGLNTVPLSLETEAWAFVNLKPLEPTTLPAGGKGSLQMVSYLSGSFENSGFTYGYEIWGGILPFSTGIGSGGIPAPFAIVNFQSPTISSWSEFFRFTKADDFVETAFTKTFGWLPFPPSSAQVTVVTTSVTFATVPSFVQPNQLKCAYGDSSRLVLGKAISAGVYGCLTTSFPTSASDCGSPGTIGRYFCKVIIDNPKIFQAQTLLNFYIATPFPPLSVILGFKLNDVTIAPGFELSLLTLQATVGPAGIQKMLFEFQFGVELSSDLIWFSGSISVTLPGLEGSSATGLGDPTQFLSLSALYSGYINNFCGFDRLTVGFASLGPIKLSPQLLPTYGEFSGTLIMYSPNAVGNPSLSSTPEANIDYCAAGGADALSQNCLSVTLAFGAGTQWTPFGSKADVWFYFSTNNVAISPRSVLCVVFGVCLSPTDFIGRTLGELLITSLTVSQSRFVSRYLNSGVIVPTGYRMDFNATLFTIFGTTIHAVCVAFFCALQGARLPPHS